MTQNHEARKEIAMNNDDFDRRQAAMLAAELQALEDWDSLNELIG